MDINNEYRRNPRDDDKMNKRFVKLNDDNLKTSMKDSGEDVKDLSHGNPASGQTTKSPLFNTHLMEFVEMLEAMDTIANSLDGNTTDLTNQSVNPESVGDDTDLLDELNKIFTPILVMQGYENDVSDKIQESFSDANVLTERNIIKFDDTTRMAQLLSVCALLIARKKNTEKWQMYQKAAVIRNKMKVDIQKDEYEEAKVLAQKFLVKVSTSNNSPVARDAATKLLPETQH